MNPNLIMLLTGVLGTLGFIIMYGIDKKRIIYVVMGAVITTLTYILLKDQYSIFISNLLSAAVATIYAEIMARVIKAPTTIFLIPAVVPLVPGGSLYYTMLHLINNSDMASKYGNETVLCALGISVGIIICSILAQLFLNLYNRTMKRIKNKKCNH